MTGFVLRGFKGMRPILNPKLLEGNEAQVATDVRLFSGAIEPVKGNENVVALKSTGTVQTIFRARTNADETLNWFEFSGDVNAALSPITNDEYGRVYWTGDGAPKYAPESLAFATGSGAYPRGAYTLGIPKPTVTPTAVGSEVLDPATETRYYVVTYYNSSTGKESGISDEVSTKVLTNYVDNGTLYPSTWTQESSTSYLIEFSQDHILSVGDFIGITGSTVTGWNKAWEVESVPSVRSVKIKNTQTFPGSAPAGSYTVKKRYLPTAKLIALPSDDTDTQVTHKRIYRKVGATWYLLTTLPIDTVEYDDNATSTTVSAGATMSTSVQTRPIKPLSAPVASVSYNDTSIADNRALTTPAATVNRLYAVSYVTAAGVEGPLSGTSAIVEVLDGTTEVRFSHTQTTVPTGVTKKRIYRQNITYTSGTYSVNESNFKLLVEIPITQDVYLDTVAQSTLASRAAPTNPDAINHPTTAFAAIGKLVQRTLAESRVYVYTYVSAYGEEGPPSDPSTLIDIDPFEPVTVTTAGAPTGAYNITKKYIYRTSTGSGATDYQFVGEQPVATTTYTDSVAQANLGEPIPSVNWEPPSQTMTGLTVMANGIFVGFDDKDVCFSESYMPHAWSSLNRLTVDRPIVALGAFGQSVAVLTDSYPYIVSGIDPQAMSLQKTSLQQACVSKRSVVEVGDGVIYASPDGLVMINGGGVQVMTQKLISQEQWQAYKPESIHAYIHEGRYYAFYDTGTEEGLLVFNLTGLDAALSIGTQTTTAATVVPTADSLMIVEGGYIKKMDKSSTARTYTWKSKLQEYPQPINFSAGQVLAESYSPTITMKVYADGVLRHTQTVTDAHPFRLPSGFIARDWQVELTGSTKVTFAAITQSVTELKGL